MITAFLQLETGHDDAFISPPRQHSGHGHVALWLSSLPVWAAGSNMPWEQPLNQILQSVEGPAAKIIAVIIVIVSLALATRLVAFVAWFRSFSVCPLPLRHQASFCPSSPSAAAW